MDDSDVPDETTQTEKTQPPSTVLRYPTPAELFKAMPALGEMCQHRPREDELAGAFVARLRGSTTPEDAITFTAFAVRPKMGVWWGYECLRSIPENLSREDRELMEMIATWTRYADNENRYRVMKVAMWAPKRTPTVHLGLAVGWSGGPVAPNDPAPVPPSRTPRAISAAVLSCAAQGDLSRRSVALARFIDLAEGLFRV